METRKNFNVDLTSIPFMYLFEHGGTSCMKIAGEDNGRPFMQDLVALHVSGKYFVEGNEVEGESSTIIGLHLDCAEQLLSNLTETIADFKDKAGLK
jgi:hypothetical protein